MYVEVVSMPQLHLYVNEKTAEYIKQRADARGMSVSAYLAQLVKRDVATGWPDDFFTRIAGCWKGDPLRRGPQRKSEARDRL